MGNINTKQYWDERFENNWEEMLGKEQTDFFANLFVHSMPEWLADEIKQEKLSICDFGCAAGQAVRFLCEKFDTKVCGIDFSEKAIMQAKKLYPDLEFFCFDITSADRKEFYTDIGYTSNVLEHLDRPWEAAENISHHVHKYLIILLPFRENVKISEHCNIFDISNIPMAIDDFDLAYMDEIDCTKIEGTLYEGSQILLLYIKKGMGHKIPSVGDIAANLESKRLDELREKIQVIHRLEDEVQIKKQKICGLESTIQSEKQKVNDYKNKLHQYQDELKSIKKQNLEVESQILSLIEHIRAILHAGSFSKLLKIHAVLGALKRENLLGRCNLIKNLGLRIVGVKKILGINKYRMDLQIEMYLKKIGNLHAASWQAQSENARQAVDDKKHKRNCICKIRKILASDYDRIVIWNSSFGWDVTLFQRPQHIAFALSKQKALVFYEVTEYTDPGVRTFFEQSHNLWLVNRNSIAYQLLKTELQKIEKPKYMQIYSTEQELTVGDLNDYQREGYHILYEYIDDINPDISVTKKVPVNIRKKYEYVMQNSEIPVVATADRLYEDVKAKRGKKNLVFSTNGVDYEHFANVERMLDIPLKREYRTVLEKGNIIIGYYGALASWFDYQMVKEIAARRKDIIFVLIGKVYDGAFAKSGITKYKNIVYLGEVSYHQLPAYAKCFDICTIPFVVNELTNATSPLKLFEYMALSKPIITTGMHECKKYDSVLIADSCDEFCEKIDIAMSYIREKNEQYFQLLKKEALENTWSAKAESIMDMLENYEKTKKNVNTGEGAKDA